MRRRVPSHDDAEELSHDVFLALHTYILEHGFPDSLPSILNAIIRGKLSNYIQAKSRFSSSVELTSSGSEERSAPDLDRAIDLRELAQHIGSQLSPLPEAICFSYPSSRPKQAFEAATGSKSQAPLHPPVMVVPATCKRGPCFECAIESGLTRRYPFYNKKSGPLTGSQLHEDDQEQYQHCRDHDDEEHQNQSRHQVWGWDDHPPPGSGRPLNVRSPAAPPVMDGR